MLFLPPAHRLVIELPTLLLELVITYIECISSKTMIAHLICKTIIIGRILTKYSLLLKTISRIIIINIMSIVFRVGSRLVVILLLVVLLLRVAMLQILIIIQSVLPTLERCALIFRTHSDLLLVLRSSIEIA